MTSQNMDRLIDMNLRLSAAVETMASRIETNQRSLQELAFVVEKIIKRMEDDKQKMSNNQNIIVSFIRKFI